MRHLLIACFVLTNIYGHAQDSTFTDTRKPFVEHDTVYLEAGFPGGNTEWKKYVERNLRPETAANHKAPKGIYNVTASFAIDTSGYVIQVQILEDPGYGTGEDVKRVLNNSPVWLPAAINGKPVIYRQKERFTYQVIEE